MSSGPATTDSKPISADGNLASWTAQLLKEHEGSSFEIIDDRAQADLLHLIEVTSSSLTAPAGDRVAFSLIFRLEKRDRFYPQGCRSLKHAHLGTETVFLVPIGPDAEGMRYEAVFN